MNHELAMPTAITVAKGGKSRKFFEGMLQNYRRTTEQNGIGVESGWYKKVRSTASEMARSGATGSEERDPISTQP